MNATDIRDTATLDDEEWRDQYDEMLDDIYGEIEIAGLKYQTSRTMRIIDETAYRTGFCDWLDSIPEPWKCGECDETYENEDEAEECCTFRNPAKYEALEHRA